MAALGQPLCAEGLVVEEFAVRSAASRFFVDELFLKLVMVSSGPGFHVESRAVTSSMVISSITMVGLLLDVLEHGLRVAVVVEGSGRPYRLVPRSRRVPGPAVRHRTMAPLDGRLLLVGPRRLASSRPIGQIARGLGLPVASAMRARSSSESLRSRMARRPASDDSASSSRRPMAICSISRIEADRLLALQGLAGILLGL